MRERVIEMHRVLKPTGSFFLHCDWHASHHLRVMLDGVFGDERFRNEIVWSYKRWTASRRQLPRMHDTILFYTKTEDAFFSVPTQPNVDPNPSQYVSAKDDRGKTIVAKDKEGRPLKRQVAEEIQVGDVWEIPLMSPVSKERLGYPTQKPEALMKRIVEMASRQGDIVLDPFAGCGTTMVAAHLLKRKWIGVDISATAVKVMRWRMDKIGAGPVKLVGMPVTEAQLRALRPFEFQNWVVQEMHGTHAPRRTGDMGIDGYSFLEHDPIQVKQADDIGRNVVDNFETAVERGGRKKGYIVGFGFTRGAHEEVARAKTYKNIDIRLVAVAELLSAPDVVTPQPTLIEQAPLPMARQPEARPSADELIRSEKGAR